MSIPIAGTLVDGTPIALDTRPPGEWDTRRSPEDVVYEEIAYDDADELKTPVDRARRICDALRKVGYLA